MTKVRVNASRSYDVRIAPGILCLIGEYVRRLFPAAQKAAIVTDQTVGALYAQKVSESLAVANLLPICYSMPPGEASKNGAQYLSLLALFAQDHLTRSDVVIALGGGVVGDLAGFAAATYLRGVPVVQIPTSLLAMVDSSVGGKTGVDMPSGKNLVGAFHQPSLVLCDTNTIRSLPEAVFRDGLAEVVKYGMLGRPTLLNRLTVDFSHAELEPIIAECVTMKRDIVQTDEFDTGERMLLNFGHTIAHAIEQLSNYQISHGFAVAVGMAIDTRAAVKQGLCPPECLQVLTRLLKRFALPLETAFDAKSLYDAALADKKRAGDEIAIVVPTALGKCELKQMPVNDLLGWIEMGLNP